MAFTKSWTFLDGLGFLRRSLCRALTIFPLAQHNCQKISIGADKPRGYLPDVRSMPGSRIALETGTHSPWVTRPRSDRGPCPERALDWGEPAQRRSPGCADFGSSGADDGQGTPWSAQNLEGHFSKVWARQTAWREAQLPFLLRTKLVRFALFGAKS